MEVENQSSGVESDNTESQVEVTSGQEGSEGSTDAGTGVEGVTQETTQEGGEEGAGAETPEYTPNLKFKVMDKEHEFASYLKDVIKDEKTEKEVRELYEKAYGLDIVKPKYQETRKELLDLRQEHHGVMEGINDLRLRYQRGDLDGFFDKLNIPHERVLQWAVEKAQYSQLPPEQKAQWDRNRQTQKQAWESEDSRRQTESSYGDQLSQVTGELLELSLERDEVKRFAANYDAKVGKPGAFREAVMEVGGSAWDRGHKLTPMQAIREVMNHYGKFLPTENPSPQGQGAPKGGQGQTPPAGGQRKEPPVIPNVSGKTSSPTASGPKSIEDLKKIAASFQ